MSYAPVDVPAFGGLDLRDSEDATGATSILNVDVSDPTRISARNGYSISGFSWATLAPTLYPSAIAPVVLKYVVGGDTYVTVVDSNAASAAQSTTQTTSSSPWSFIQYKPGSCTYGTNGSNQNILKATDSAITNPSVTVDGSGSLASPRCYALLIQPNDNRLMCIGATTLPNGVTGSAAHVMFSNPNNPEVYTSTDWVKLGEGGSYLAGAVWNGQAMAFSAKNIAVFYGNSTDAVGGAVFNYRLVQMPAPGGWVLNAGQVVAGDNGVYVILPGSGVWITTGGKPVKVSERLDSAFQAGTYTANPLGTAFAYAGRVHFPIYVSNVAGYWLILDEATGEFTISQYALPLLCGASAGTTALLPSRVAGIASLDSTSTDAGTAISSHYQSAWGSFGSPGVEKLIRQTELHGTGTVAVSWGANQQAHGIPRTVTMLNGRGLDRTAVRGGSLSWKVAGTGAWTVNRVIPYLRERRRVGVRT